MCQVCEYWTHRKCYGSELRHKLKEGQKWVCQRCKNLKKEDLSLDTFTCWFCPDNKGLMKRVRIKNKCWAHMSCIHWTKEAQFKGKHTRKEKLSRSIYKTKKKCVFPKCYLCQINWGFPLKCGNVECEEYFHVKCAINYGLIKDVTLKDMILCGSCKGSS